MSKRLVTVLSLSLVCGCATSANLSTVSSIPGNGQPDRRLGDEIVVAGRFVHTGTRVVLFSDPGGFNAYPSHHFNQRDLNGMPVNDLPSLQQAVDQFVMHYDQSGSSSICFRVLEERGLSVQLMLDTDGTIYQTMDLRERAWHATKSNNRSVGIEIANIGAYPPGDAQPMAWYQQHPVQPARPGLGQGVVQGELLRMGDLTEAQYVALGKLTRAICRALPRITCDYPRDASGHLVNHALSPGEFAAYHGLLGHYHVQTDKIDPGPAFNWDRLIRSAR